MKLRIDSSEVSSILLVPYVSFHLAVARYYKGGKPFFGLSCDELLNTDGP